MIEPRLGDGTLFEPGMVVWTRAYILEGDYYPPLPKETAGPALILVPPRGRDSGELWVIGSMDLSLLYSSKRAALLAAIDRQEKAMTAIRNEEEDKLALLRRELEVEIQRAGDA